MSDTSSTTSRKSARSFLAERPHEIPIQRDTRRGPVRIFVRGPFTCTVGAAAVESTDVLKIESGFVDANGVLIYYEALGHGQPLLILHGGPGASHDYFLPYLLPLARTNRVVFIDERGSGKSEKLEDPKGYTVENMVEDVEAVRQHLSLGKMNLLGHSYGGVLAEAYALKYQANLRT